MTDLEFSIAQNHEVAEIAALVNSAYRGESSRVGWTTEESLLGGQRTDEALLTEVIAAPDSTLHLARVRKTGELVACCHLQKKSDVAYLGLLTVSPGKQGSGLGRELLRHAEHYAAKAWECSRLEMTVISLREELISYYERRGYRRTGEHRPFPMNDSRFGIPKRRDFDLLVLEKDIASSAAPA